MSQVVCKPIHLDETVKCSLHTFSVDTMEFSAVMQIVYPKRSVFTQKDSLKTFSAVTMDFGTFSADTMEFSTIKMGIFGKFVLLLFYSYGGNRTLYSS